MSTYGDLAAMADDLERSLDGLRRSVEETRRAIKSGESHLAAVRFAIAQGRGRDDD